MADNVVANQISSSGAIFATDDINGIHYPISKISYGDSDNAISISISNGLPVQPSNDTRWIVSNSSGIWPVQENGSALTALQLIDDAIYSSGILPLVKGIAVMGADFSTPRFLRTDASGELQIDVLTLPNITGTVTANAGTNLNTSALALETGGNLESSATSLAILDDWDETDRAKVNIIVDQAGISAGAGAVGNNTPRMTLASDDPAVASLQTIDDAISGNEMQVDIIASLPAGTNNIGDVDILSLIPGTSTTNLGKAIDAASGVNDVGVAILGIRDDALTTLTQSEGDYVPFFIDSVGRLHVNVGNTITETNSGDIKTAIELLDDVVATDGSSVLTKGFQIAGTDGTNSQIIATDTNGFIKITDGGSYISVDGVVGISGTVALSAGNNNIGDVDITSITAGDNVIGRVKLTDGTDVADVLDLSNSNPLTVAIVDGTGDQITSFGGGTQYTEGDTDATITGTAMMMEIAGDALEPVQGTVADGLLVNLGSNNDISITSVVPGTSTTNLGKAIDSPSGVTDTGIALLSIRDDTLGTLTQSEGDYVPLFSDSTGKLHVNVGNVVSVDTTGFVNPVSGTVNVIQLTASQLNCTEVNSSAIRTAVEIIDNVIAGSEMQVDVVAELPAGTNNIGDVDIASIAAGDNNIGNVDIASISAGDNNIGNVDIVTMPSIPTGGNLIGNIGLYPSISSGLASYKTISAASTNATSIKSTPGQIYDIFAHNINAAVRYLKLYQKASAPTVGTDVPMLTFPIPGNTAGAGFAYNSSYGISCVSGIAFALTTGVADSDTGAVAANEIVVNILYK